MNLFKRNKKEINLEDLETTITSKIDKLAIAITEKDFERERYLEDLAFNAKHERIKEYEDRIKGIKAESECKDVVINQQQEDIEKYKKDLEENELLLKAANDKNKKLEKELKELKDNGVMPKRKVPGSTMPRKKQTVGIKESKVSGAAKTELKKINELREKEEV